MAGAGLWSGDGDPGGCAGATGEGALAIKTSVTKASTASNSYGFSMKPTAPRVSAISLNSCCLLAVMKTTGMSEACSRRRWATEKPPPTGIIMSRRTRSGLPSMASRRPYTPSAAVKTS